MKNGLSSTLRPTAASQPGYQTWEKKRPRNWPFGQLYEKSVDGVCKDFMAYVINGTESLESRNNETKKAE
jgi:hypothetical protein